MPRHLEKEKEKKVGEGDSFYIDMLLSAMSVLVVEQPSSELPEGLMNYPLLSCFD
jgi:hypothetical protein